MVAVLVVLRVPPLTPLALAAMLFMIVMMMTAAAILFMIVMVFMITMNRSSPRRKESCNTGV